MNLAVDDGLIGASESVFDYGCGRGDDIRLLSGLGYAATGWDPNFAPDAPRQAADVVNLGYVVNVIEDPAERRDVLLKAWQLARKALVVSARLRWEASGRSRDRDHADGIITSAGTFQKFYDHDELRVWIETTMHRPSVAAAPGIFYVFRDDVTAQRLLARRARGHTSGAPRIADILYEQHRHALAPLQTFVETHRRVPKRQELDTSVLEAEFGSVRRAFGIIRRATGSDNWRDVKTGRGPSSSEKRYEAHKELLAPLLEVLRTRGRLPRDDELDVVPIVEVFGAIKPAFSLARRVLGDAEFDEARERCRTDFLVYLALAAFGGRPRVSELASELQYDAREFFGSYAEACREADKMLFGVGKPGAVEGACRSAPFGKLTPEALYVHAAAIDRLPPLLRVYEGCARALSGTVDQATVLKLHRQKPQVSYLSYPDFDRVAHPALAFVVIARLGSLRITARDFRESENPPILHRKECFVPDDYPRRSLFERLTRQEERNGLLDDPTSIGTMNGWQTRLTAVGATIRGHRVVLDAHSGGAV